MQNGALQSFQRECIFIFLMDVFVKIILRNHYLTTKKNALKNFLQSGKKKHFDHCSSRVIIYEMGFAYQQRLKLITQNIKKCHKHQEFV